MKKNIQSVIENLQWGCSPQSKAPVKRGEDTIYSSGSSWEDVRFIGEDGYERIAPRANYVGPKYKYFPGFKDTSPISNSLDWEALSHIVDVEPFARAGRGGLGWQPTIFELLSFNLDLVTPERDVSRQLYDALRPLLNNTQLWRDARSEEHRRTLQAAFISDCQKRLELIHKSKARILRQLLNLYMDAFLPRYVGEYPTEELVYPEAGLRFRPLEKTVARRIRNRLLTYWGNAAEGTLSAPDDLPLLDARASSCTFTQSNFAAEKRVWKKVSKGVSRSNPGGRLFPQGDFVSALASVGYLKDRPYERSNVWPQAINPGFYKMAFFFAGSPGHLEFSPIFHPSALSSEGKEHVLGLFCNVYSVMEKYPHLIGTGSLLSTVLTRELNLLEFQKALKFLGSGVDTGALTRLWCVNDLNCRFKVSRVADLVSTLFLIDLLSCRERQPFTLNPEPVRGEYYDSRRADPEFWERCAPTYYGEEESIQCIRDIWQRGRRNPATSLGTYDLSGHVSNFLYWLPFRLRYVAQRGLSGTPTRQRIGV